MDIEEKITPGKILYLRASLPPDWEPREKYWVVVGAGNYPLLLKINTSNQLPKIAQKMKESQFRLKKEIYTFLKYDSYLDCGTVWYTLITTEDIRKQLADDPDRFKGDVIEDHKNEIIRRTGLSKSIEPRHKRVITEALRKK